MLELKQHRRVHRHLKSRGRLPDQTDDGVCGVRRRSRDRRWQQQRTNEEEELHRRRRAFTAVVVGLCGFSWVFLRKIPFLLFFLFIFFVSAIKANVSGYLNEEAYMIKYEKD